MVIREMQDNFSPTVELSFSLTPDKGLIPSPVEVEEGLSKATQHTDGESHVGQTTPEWSQRNMILKDCPDDRRRVVQHQGQKDDLYEMGGSPLHQVPSLLLFTLSIHPSITWIGPARHPQNEDTTEHIDDRNAVKIPAMNSIPPPVSTTDTRRPGGSWTPLIPGRPLDRWATPTTRSHNTLKLCILSAFSQPALCFSNSLEGVPKYAEHLLAAFHSLLGTTHPKQSQLCWGWVIVQARSSDADLHHILLGPKALTQPGGLMGHCPVEKQMFFDKPKDQFLTV